MALLLAWAVLLVGLAALVAWTMTRSILPPSYQADRQAYEAVLPEASRPEASRPESGAVKRQEAEPRSARMSEESGSEDETELTRPPALPGKDSEEKLDPAEPPRVEEAPLIFPETSVGDEGANAEIPQVPAQTSPAPEDSAPPAEAAAPEASESQRQTDLSAPAIPEEDRQDDATSRAESAGRQTNDKSQAEQSGADEPGTDSTEAQDEGRQEPAFAPPQASPGLPPPPIPGRTRSETEEVDDAPAAESPTGQADSTAGEKDISGQASGAADANETVQQAVLPDPGKLPTGEPAESGTESGTESGAGDTLSAWQHYAQPFTVQEDRPLVAIVVSGLGLSDSATDAAIRQLPAEVTLSFSPYARRLDEWISLARSRGHEVLLDLPMEPETYPADDPGPQAILTSLGPQENASRLQWVLGRGSAYVGVTAAQGGGFTASRGDLEALFEQLAEAGLIFVGNPAEGKAAMQEAARRAEMPLLLSDRILDKQAASRSVIDAALSAIERTAQAEGEAVAVARPYPVSLERLQAWSDQLSGRGLQIAPLSALVRQ